MSLQQGMTFAGSEQLQYDITLRSFEGTPHHQECVKNWQTMSGFKVCASIFYS